MRLRLLALVAVVTTGCFSAARPIKRMEQGDIMIGANINVPGSIADPEISAWFRIAPFDGTDITAGATGTMPFTAGWPNFGGGGFLELRGHIPFNDTWRLVLDAQGEFYRLRIRDQDWSSHWRSSFVPYFVADFAKITMYFGPKGAWLTGVREVAAPQGANPIKPVPGAPGMVFVGLSLGAEDPQPFLFFTSIGAAFDVGTVFAADTGVVAVPLAYSISLYFGFL